MRKYKIREEKFEDGRSEFIPQFEEGGQFHDFFDLSGFNKDRLPLISRRFKTYEGKGGRARLIVTHYCGDSKEDLIGQLETLIYGLKNGFDEFAC